MTTAFSTFRALWLGDKGFGEIHGLNSAAKASKSHFGILEVFSEVSSDKKPCRTFLQKLTNMPAVSF